MCGDGGDGHKRQARAACALQLEARMRHSCAIEGELESEGLQVEGAAEGVAWHYIKRHCLGAGRNGSFSGGGGAQRDDIAGETQPADVIRAAKVGAWGAVGKGGVSEVKQDGACGAGGSFGSFGSFGPFGSLV